MKKIVFLSSLVLAAGLTFPAVAFAQNEQPSCAEALTAYNQAQAEVEAAVKADKALADAQKAVEDARKLAEAADTRAVEQQAVADAADKAAADAQAKATTADAVVSPTPESIKTRDEQRAIAAAKLAERDSARAAVTAALAERDAQRAKLPSLESTVADARKVAEADAAELAAAMETERLVADEACKGPQGKPGATVTVPPPASGNANAGSDFDQVGSVPVGGVATGGGPA